MIKKYDCVVFDVDGTLLDTSQGVLESVKYAIEYFNLPKLSDEELETFIGPPIQNSFENHYNVDKSKAQEIATVFRGRYKNEDLLKAKAYNGIFDVLDYLKNKGINIAIATYKRQDYAIKIMEHFGFDKYTDVIIGADHENKLKKQDIIKIALSKSNCDFNRCVMVGDSDNDAIGALNIGIDFVAVTYGFGFKTQQDAEEYKNIGIANSPLELEQIILGE